MDSAISSGSRGYGTWLTVLRCGYITVPVLLLAGCVSDTMEDESAVAVYQRLLAAQGPQARLDSEADAHRACLGLLEPNAVDEPAISPLEVAADPNTGREIVALTIEQALVRALANSPEITVVSFDPAIARHEITKAAADFDPTLFAEASYEDQDNPENSIFEPGQAETRAFESGIRQRIGTGAQWSASYALTRRWDDLIGRTLPTRYEPVCMFQLRQPLLRDAGRTVNLAGVDIARLEYQAALLGFRQKAEEVATVVIQAYWQLLQTRRELEIQQRLLARTLETLAKVEGRREIDATDVQIQQARSYAKSREGMLVQLEKRRRDAQDILARLLADPQINTISRIEVIPASVPDTNDAVLEMPIAPEAALSLALENSPALEHARLALEVADINIRVARNQAMPRLDLTGSARTQGLDRERPAAGSDMWSGDHASYAVGLSFEYPLGDRGPYAELLKRRLERRKALSTLQNLADQVAVQVKERLRKVETNLAEIEIQREAAAAARTYLQALEDSEIVRQQLTAEFLLVKLQAQEILAQAERSEIGAIAQFNIAVAELAQASGTVLELHQVAMSLPKAPQTDPDEIESEIDIEGPTDEAEDDYSLEANPRVSSSQ